MTRKAPSSKAKGGHSNNNNKTQQTLFASLPKVDINGKLWLPTPYTSTKVSKLKKKLKALTMENDNFYISHAAYEKQIAELQQELEKANTKTININCEHSDEEFQTVLDERNALALKVAALENDQVDKENIEDLQKQLQCMTEEARRNYTLAVAQKRQYDSLNFQHENLKRELEFVKSLLDADVVFASPISDVPTDVPTDAPPDNGCDLLNFP